MRPTWAEVNLTALAENVAKVKDYIGPDVLLNCVVKGDAYGHGARQIAAAALNGGADSLSVATIEEAAELRSSGICGPILVLGFVPPKDAWQVARENLTATVFLPEQAQALQAAAARAGKTIKIHLKLDTGMSRIGIAGSDQDVLFAKSLKTYENLEFEGLFSHFSLAETENPSLALQQLHKFEIFSDQLKILGACPPVLHMANTAAIFRFKESHFNMVRLGVGMYGSMPASIIEDPLDLRPVMTLKTSIVYIKEVEKGRAISYDGTWIAPKDSLIGTLPIGYADGLSRSFGNKAQVWVRGTLVPVVGRVCMDQTMIDLSQVPQAQSGDEVIIFGESQPKRSTLMLAEEVGEIPHQITAVISKRVPRFYNNLK
ncbi:MAG: alanine racemase [Firmicutes bacterium]|jgi:alanine racemase|nr:alanine racemase [Bacillota bacterium]